MLQQSNEYDIFIFFQKFLLSLHLKSNVHNASKEIKCRRCEHTAFSKKDFYDHMEKMHKVIYNIRCEYEGCNLVTSDNTKLRTHINSVHLGIKRNRYEKEVACEYEGCCHIAPSKDYLTRHIKLVHKEKSFKCQKCDYSAFMVSTHDENSR